MTAESGHGNRPAVDLFLLAGRFPDATHGDTLRHALAYGIAAEDAGFDGAWIAEHHFIDYGVCPSAIAFAAHLLGRTTRLHVGTAASILSARHPVALAEEAVLLDEVSGGRFHLGVARGGPWVDLEVFGTGLARYTTGFADSLDLLRTWLSGAERVGAAGEHFAFRPVTVVPRPRRPVPTWVAATSGPTVDIAAARGLPLLLGMHAASAEQRRLLARYATGAAAGGHDPDTVGHAVAHLAYVADSVDRAHADLRASMPGWLATTSHYVRLDADAGPGRNLGAYLDHLLDIHPVGPPALCVDRLAASVEATGAGRLLLMVEGGGCPPRTLEMIARLGAEVLPQLR